MNIAHALSPACFGTLDCLNKYDLRPVLILAIGLTIIFFLVTTAKLWLPKGLQRQLSRETFWLLLSILLVLVAVQMFSTKTLFLLFFAPLILIIMLGPMLFVFGGRRTSEKRLLYETEDRHLPVSSRVQNSLLAAFDIFLIYQLFHSPGVALVFIVGLPMILYVISFGGFLQERFELKNKNWMFFTTILYLCVGASKIYTSGHLPTYQDPLFQTCEGCWGENIQNMVGLDAVFAFLTIVFIGLLFVGLRQHLSFSIASSSTNAHRLFERLHWPMWLLVFIFTFLTFVSL